jgi:hypothetical protein
MELKRRGFLKLLSGIIGAVAIGKLPLPIETPTVPVVLAPPITYAFINSTPSAILKEFYTDDEGYMKDLVYNSTPLLEMVKK